MKATRDGCGAALLMLTAFGRASCAAHAGMRSTTERALWRIPAERMKMKAEHTVPLSQQALACRHHAAISGSSAPGVSIPVLPGQAAQRRHAEQRTGALGYKGIATAHGFRTLFSTCANEAGWNRDCHREATRTRGPERSRGAYNRAQWLDERAKLMQWWADRIDQLRKGADVIPFKAA